CRSTRPRAYLACHPATDSPPEQPDRRRDVAARERYPHADLPLDPPAAQAALERGPKRGRVGRDRGERATARDHAPGLVQPRPATPGAAGESGRSAWAEPVSCPNGRSATAASKSPSPNGSAATSPHSSRPPPAAPAATRLRRAQSSAPTSRSTPKAAPAGPIA